MNFAIGSLLCPVGPAILPRDAGMVVRRNHVLKPPSLWLFMTFGVHDIASRVVKKVPGLPG